jgi:hypothetical protein
MLVLGFVLHCRCRFVSHVILFFFLLSTAVHRPVSIHFHSVKFFSTVCDAKKMMMMLNVNVIFPE